MWVMVALLYYIPNETPYRIDIPFETYEDCIELGRQTNMLRLKYGADGIDTICVMQSPEVPLVGTTV